MLTEEAHHMFVGETGVGRTLQATAEAMVKAGIEDPSDIARVRALGVVDLPTIQKKLNLHFTLVARSLRLGGLHQRRQFLQRRSQGPLPRDQDQRRPPL